MSLNYIFVLKLLLLFIYFCVNKVSNVELKNGPKWESERHIVKRYNIPIKWEFWNTLILKEATSY